MDKPTELIIEKGSMKDLEKSKSQLKERFIGFIDKHDFALCMVICKNKETKKIITALLSNMKLTDTLLSLDHIEKEIKTHQLLVLKSAKELMEQDEN